MLYPSFFNVFAEDGPQTRVCSLVSKRFYEFPLPWDEVITCAAEDADVADRLVQAGLLMTREGYVEQIDEYLKRADLADGEELAVYFCVTSACGLSCPYCYLNHTARRAASPAVIDAFLAALDCRLSEPPFPSVMHLVLCRTTATAPAAPSGPCARIICAS